MDLEALGSTTVLGAIVVVTNAITLAITRWASTRREGRRDALEHLQDAYQQALQRLARVEGRADEQSRALIAAQQQLADERVRYATRVTELEIRVAQLETERAHLRQERDELRQRIADLEAERDGLRADLAAGRPRKTTPPRPLPAQR